MKKIFKRVVSVLKGVSTLDTMTRNPRIILLLLITMMALSGAVSGGHSTLDLVDPTFNPQIRTSSIANKYVEQIISLPDGKTLVTGSFNSYNRQPVGGLVRLNADATLDTTFNNNAPAGKIVLQADGKILVLRRDFSQTPPVFGLRRLNSDGTPDPTFDFNVEMEQAEALMIDADGRIILDGRFPENDGWRSIIRLNPDGSLDNSFQFALNVSARARAVQNNKIIISSLEGLQRLDVNGTIDPSFITRNFVAYDFIVQPDGKILVLDYKLQRLNENGSDDAGFTITTFPNQNQPQKMVRSSDGKITVAIGAANGFGQIRRFLANGTADASFMPYNAARYNTHAVQADGGVLIGDGDGGGQSHQILLNDFVRLFPNGSPDPTFNPGGIGFQYFLPGTVRAIDIQPGGKILIGGKFDEVNDVARSKIARLNADSTLDASFQINTSGTGNYFSRILEFYNIRAQNDGKIVATGNFDYVVNGATKSNLVRLNPDGSIDSTFNLQVPIGDLFGPMGFGTNRFVNFNDGKLLVGTSRLMPTEFNVPVKITASGARDFSFFPEAYYQQNIVVIYDLAVQPDGKILIGGSHTTYLPDMTSISKSFLTRLYPNGFLDESFEPYETLNNGVRAFVLLPNGKIVLAERSFISPNMFQTNILRLNPDGSVDPTFNAGTGADGTVNAMLLLSTGRIFVGGKFTNFNGQPRSNLVQLNADGSVFTPVYNLNAEVLSLAVDADGRVLIGGDFTVISAGGGSANRSFVAGLIDAPSTRFDFDGDRRADLGVFDNANGIWSIFNSQSYQQVSTHFGLSGDKPAPADFDGDGKTDIAVYRPAEGNWYLLRSTEGFGVIRFGAPEDKPVPADFDGDGKADIAVWRPGTGVWYVLQSLDHQAFAVHFGLTDDIPLTGANFDGDRRADIAVWRPSNGNFYWLASGSGYQFRVVHFGANGDIPSVGDFNGDGKTDLVVYRPAEGNWYQNLSAATGEYEFAVTNFGLNGDEPVAADYNGDGKTDIAVRRSGVWHLLLSDQGYLVATFGNAAARAVAAMPSQ